MANWHKRTQQSDLQWCPLNLIHLWYVYQMKTAVLSSLFSCPNNQSLAPRLPWFQIKAVVFTALWAVRPLLPRIPSWSQSSGWVVLVARQLWEPSQFFLSAPFHLSFTLFWFFFKYLGFLISISLELKIFSSHHDFFSPLFLAASKNGFPSIFFLKILF